MRSGSSQQEHMMKSAEPSIEAVVRLPESDDIAWARPTGCMLVRGHPVYTMVYLAEASNGFEWSATEMAQGLLAGKIAKATHLGTRGQGAGAGASEGAGVAGVAAACEAIATSGVLVTTTRRDDSNSDGNELGGAETLECLRVWGLTLALLSDEENAVRASAATHVSIALERERPSSTPVAYCPPRSVAMVFAHLQRCYSPADAAAPVRSPVWPRWLIGVCLGDRHLAASVAKALPALEGNAVGGDAIRAGARVTDHAHSAQLRHWHPERIARAAATALAAGRSDEVRAALVAAIGVCAASALTDVTPLPASAAADAGVAALKVTVLGGPHEMHARGCAVLRRLRILREALL
jgi:hypothetical protein